MTGRVAKLHGSDVVCLCYHAVSERWPSLLAVTPQQLERQLSPLVAHGWVGATFSQAVLDPPARRTLAVTFDDAFGSVIEHALPILSDLGLPGTVFAPTAFMAKRQPLCWQGIDGWAVTDHARELTAMDWHDLRELAEHGWEIGSHTRTHPRLTRLGDRALADEFESSRADCERALGVECRSIAYPYGDVNEHVAAAARAAGYSTGACMSSNLRARGPHLSPRIGIYQADAAWRFALKLSAATRGVRRSRLWPDRLDSQVVVQPTPAAPRRASASS